MNRRVAIALVLAIAGGCDTAEVETSFRGTPPFVPEDDAANCLDRQGEVVGTDGAQASMRGFVADALRWAAADVGPSTRAKHQGVTSVGSDDRGQEYVEYYAVVSPQLVSAALDAKPIALGQLDARSNVTDNALPDAVARALEDAEGDATVGACIFHSWQTDIDTPLPACEGDCMERAAAAGDDASFPFAEYAVPLPLTPENFRMKRPLNGSRAAADLAVQCFRGTQQDGSPAIPAFEAGKDTEDPFFRGCMAAGTMFQTDWRRSDPSVCAAANRLRECGCSIPGVTDGLDLPKAAQKVGDALVPPEGKPGWYRGFPLGRWADSDPKRRASTPLLDRLGAPAGCRYVNVGDDSKTVIACRLTVDDLLDDVENPKETCREKYGMDVVVHVPVPADAIACTPDGSDANATCGEMPWNLGFEGDADEVAVEHDCFAARAEGGCSDDAIRTCVCEEGDGRFADDGCCTGAWDPKCVSEAEACAAREP